MIINQANNGEIFKGTYAKGVREGVGLLTWNDGAQYKGGFHKNK